MDNPKMMDVIVLIVDSSEIETRQVPVSEWGKGVFTVTIDGKEEVVVCSAYATKTTRFLGFTSEEALQDHRRITQMVAGAKAQARCDTGWRGTPRGHN